MSPEDRERVAVRRLRGIALVLLALAAVTIAISRVPVTILSDTGPRPESPRGNDLLLLYLAVLSAPGVVVALRPHRWLIAFWAVWVPPVAVCGVFLAFGGESPLDHPHPDPAWPGIAILWLSLAVHAGILIVLPVVRAIHRSPTPTGPVPRRR
jgi:hypothetical protein